MRKIDLEKQLEKYFCDKLNAIGIVNIKMNPLGKKGIPDRLVFGDNIYYVELKLGKEHESYYKETRGQTNWGKQITQSNGFYVLLEGKSEVDKFVEKMKEAKGYMFEYKRYITN